MAEIIRRVAWASTVQSSSVTPGLLHAVPVVTRPRPAPGSHQSALCPHSCVLESARQRTHAVYGRLRLAPVPGGVDLGSPEPAAVTGSFPRRAVIHQEDGSRFVPRGRTLALFPVGGICRQSSFLSCVSAWLWGRGATCSACLLPRARTCQGTGLATTRGHQPGSLRVFRVHLSHACGTEPLRGWGWHFSSG